ncbi:hypothetical protein BD311DRAFT_752019 [Dichomitus squalens]|uniref:Uncharacterized protein n=1 Tax=Dichomitus squalens TaxID=114155 RepID=A0A4Q9MUE7_9APHY|nr:hypothetical protein BD311DRAFT_752019 [Dichomitus squalens]
MPASQGKACAQSTFSASFCIHSSVGCVNRSCCLIDCNDDSRPLLGSVPAHSGYSAA